MFMYMVKVEFIPDIKKTGRKHDLMRFIDEFIDSDYEITRVVYNEDEYQDVFSAYISIKRAAVNSGHRIKVIKREKHVYLMKNW